jgi:hypothetical protein
MSTIMNSEYLRWRAWRAAWAKFRGVEFRNGQAMDVVRGRVFMGHSGERWSSLGRAARSLSKSAAI